MRKSGRRGRDSEKGDRREWGDIEDERERGKGEGDERRERQ